jgi:hypothetical protein
LESGLLSARKIWEVQKTIHYPTGFKYRLALVDPLAREVVLLYDNHWPKGPHVHLRGQQRLYEFNGLEILLMDFIEESEQEEKRYYENKKDYN